ncbi:transcriptional regulator GlxA family with amidase domain [Lewinella aquimaris]|uniref:Transcriptional regulator GlxA family with amidase domain n=1 Tax=Neolewinella aquimaris TaxID=1835722 RepID=A0A840E584_9BACT|nr:helix-turn-helix domain-containing protein [Neolewinella aquimaris]MBB4079113.1 transcriptional regulator GlxA family with amidase domain [Neolewinella aquimaris]
MLSVTTTLARTAISRLRTAEDSLTRHTILATFDHWRSNFPSKKNCRFQRTLAILRQSDGPSSVEELSQAVGVSERQLQRLFRDRVGMTPKFYLRFLRFERTYQFLVANPRHPYAEIAFRYGYADEAHLIREFRFFCGLTPRGLAATIPALS